MKPLDPVTPWVIVKLPKLVEAAHCTCLAGLGEACTHIGALLYHLVYSYGEREPKPKEKTVSFVIWAGRVYFHS